MKKLLFLILFSHSLFAQEKGDKAIQVTSTISLEEVAKVMMSNGYVIKDSNFGVNTDWKSLQGGAYRINLMMIDDKIILRGKWKNDIGNAVFNTQSMEYDIEYSKKKMNINSHLWKEMENLANQLGTEVVFKK